MSRSHKKHPIIKDKAKRWMRPIANRRLRRAITRALHNGADDDSEMPLAREITNDYDVCDFICHLSAEYYDADEQYQRYLK